LGTLKPECARFLEVRLHSSHAPKAMQSRMIFPERLQGGRHVL
jgi:hypothetical protein